ncbi:UDP-glucuronosyltransferase 2A2-like [Haliotis rufescens]|uniref:UDP-glucuronosyltransferase 2A2-like n=1 Tax=Haliotis rufescens TaxID=6454 RepID=UPI00201FA153|nr:UDP-glucuronosyltransferase 2A2-like [Haliotis rufescens]XP_048252443.1 UDP-glucuronosyltransferase 2A2-like [Haliotis rufescens]
MGPRTGIVLLFLVCVSNLEAANILFLFFPLYSHIRGSLNVATELASRGHVVWNALPTELANHKGMQLPGVNILKYESVDDYNIKEKLIDRVISDYLNETSAPPPFEVGMQVCDLILKDEKLFKALSDLHFDLIIFDIIPLPRMLAIMAYKLDVPFVFMGAAFEPHASRTPFVPSALPYPIFPWSEDMDFWTRVANVILLTVHVYVYDPFSFYGCVATYAPEKPYISMESLTTKAWLWLIDQEPFLNYNSAKLPNVMEIGSLSASAPKPLPETYKKFMDGTKEGVVIVSFGSNVKSLPDVISKKLLEAFSKTTYKYIFKTDEKVNLGPKILLTNWMPQSDLLAHPNTKLFITHCGANGQNEAFLNGVPMIGFPMFAEQPYNAKKLGYFGFGIAMDLKTFTVDDLVSNINEVIQNSSYSQKIKKAAEITKLRERSPKDEAVYWIEHVLKYGGAHLRSYCQDMPLYQYLCLDVIGLVVFIFHVCIFLIWKSCRFCCRRTVQKPKAKRE